MFEEGRGESRVVELQVYIVAAACTKGQQNAHKRSYASEPLLENERAQSISSEFVLNTAPFARIRPASEVICDSYLKAC